MGDFLGKEFAFTSLARRVTGSHPIPWVPAVCQGWMEGGNGVGGAGRGALSLLFYFGVHGWYWHSLPPGPGPGSPPLLWAAGSFSFPLKPSLAVLQAGHAEVQP